MAADFKRDYQLELYIIYLLHYIENKSNLHLCLYDLDIPFYKVHLKGILMYHLNTCHKNRELCVCY